MKLSSSSWQLRASRRAVQERRLAAHARHDDRLAALDDAAGDAFADAVADRVRRRSRPSDASTRSSPSSADSTTMPRTAPWWFARISSTRCSADLQVERARQRLADLEQRREPLRFARLNERRIGRARFSHSAARPTPTTSSSVIVTGCRNGIIARSCAPTCSMRWLALRLALRLEPLAGRSRSRRSTRARTGRCGSRRASSSSPCASRR